MKVQLIKTADAYIPESEADWEALGKVSVGERLYGDLKRPRNPAFHRKAFALLNASFANQDQFENKEAFRRWMTIKAGYYTVVVVDGASHFQAESLSFGNMDQADFEKVYSGFKDVAVTELGQDFLAGY